MKWDQIETKWAAMTRRVRGDWTPDRPDMSAKSMRRIPRPEMTPGLLADRTSAIITTGRQKTPNE